MKLDGWEESCMLIEGRGGAVQRFEFPKVVLGPEVQQGQVFDTVTPEMLEVRPLLPHQSVCLFAQAQIQLGAGLPCRREQFAAIRIRTDWYWEDPHNVWSSRLACFPNAARRLGPAPKDCERDNRGHERQDGQAFHERHGVLLLGSVGSER